jgi:hypothetical protein
MPYTVWSRGRLLGETELAYRRAMPFFRAGDFSPSELGEKLMPIIVGMPPALKALYDVTAEAPRQPSADSSDDQVHDYPEAVRRSTEYADVMSIGDELESLALELRDPSGAVVDTEDVWVNDTHRLIAIAHEAMREEYSDVEFEEFEPWETAPPRYQIMVALRGHDEAMRGGMKPDLDPEFAAELKALAAEEPDHQFGDTFWDDLDEDFFSDSDDEMDDG